MCARRSLLAAGLSIVVSAMGCGGRIAAIEMRGTVSVNGRAASAGHLTFVPQQDDQGRGGMCRIQEDGTYALEDVPIGRVTFTIAPQEKTGKQIATTDPTGNAMMTEEVLPMIPRGSYGRGQTTVTLEITPTMTNYDFALTRE